MLFVPHSADSGLVHLGSGAVLYLCCCVTLVLLCYTQCRLVPLGSGAKRPLTSLPVLSSYYRAGRTAPHRHAIMNTLSVPDASKRPPRSTALCHKFPNPKKTAPLSRAVVWGSSGLMQTCDLRLELEWAWSVTLPISGTPLRLEE